MVGGETGEERRRQQPSIDSHERNGRGGEEEGAGRGGEPEEGKEMSERGGATHVRLSSLLPISLQNE